MKTFALLLPLTLLLALAVYPVEGAAQAASKVANAMAAAPPAISQDAEIRDWDGTVLREGSNGWVCMPDIPDFDGASSMCLDEPWLEFVDAWVNQRDPNIRQMGFGYMLVGDAPSSNVDPFATGPTPDNEWIEHGVPHVMIVVPDLAALRGLSTDHTTGGPWVMWRNTPYAHIMVPIPNEGGHD